MESEDARVMTVAENRLLRALVARADDLFDFGDRIDCLKIVPVDDGGMGSLRLLSSASSKMSRRASELLFVDEDGVDVIASLNVDEQGIPFELDIWKVNYSPLIRIPSEFEFKDVTYGRE